MSLTLEQAKIALSTGGQTVDSLFDLMRSVSGRVANATSQNAYLLYSGTMPDGTSASEVAKMLQASGSAVTVGASDVGQLLKSDEFTNGHSLKLIATQLDHSDLSCTQRDLPHRKKQIPPCPHKR